MNGRLAWKLTWRGSSGRIDMVMMAAVTAAALVPFSLTSIFAFCNIADTNIGTSLMLLKSALPAWNIDEAPSAAIGLLREVSVVVEKRGNFKSTTHSSMSSRIFSSVFALSELTISVVDLPSAGRMTVME